MQGLGVSNTRHERQTNLIQAVIAAPCGGKSRFPDLLTDAVRDIGESYLCGSVVLPIFYSSVVGTPSSVDDWAGTAHEFGLAVRILWSHIAECWVDAPQFSRFFPHMERRTPTWTLSGCRGRYGAPGDRTGVAFGG